MGLQDFLEGIVLDFCSLKLHHLEFDVQKNQHTL